MLFIKHLYLDESREPIRDHRLDGLAENRTYKDLMTGHTMNAAVPEIRRFKFGQSIPSLPSHDMCSGSSGGTVDMVDVNAAVAKCNACGARVRIDNL